MWALLIAFEPFWILQILFKPENRILRDSRFFLGGSNFVLVSSFISLVMQKFCVKGRSVFRTLPLSLKHQRWGFLRKNVTFENLTFFAKSFNFRCSEYARCFGFCICYEIWPSENPINQPKVFDKYLGRRLSKYQ